MHEPPKHSSCFGWATCIITYFKTIFPIKKEQMWKRSKATKIPQITEPSYCTATHVLSLLSLSACKCIPAALKVVTPGSVTKSLTALTQPD